jgi:outer membrane lipoprotein-sorting protein
VKYCSVIAPSKLSVRLLGGAHGAVVRSALRLLFAVLTAALLAALSPTGAAAATPAALDLSKAERADLARIEAYLNGVKTVRARFMQISSTGELAEGDFYMLRPGKMRIEYRPPVPVLIVADGTWMIYYDRELEQVSYIPLDSTPAGILVADKVSLRTDAVVVTDFERESGTVRVTLVRTESPEEGSLTLVFSDKPMALKKWTVVDAQGVVTNVSLIDAKFNVPLDPDLFRFKNPNFFNEKE